MTKALTADDLIFAYEFATSYLPDCPCQDCRYFASIEADLRWHADWIGMESLPNPAPIDGRECHLLGCMAKATHEVEVMDNYHRYHYCMDHMLHAVNGHIVVSHRPLDMIVA